MRWTSQNALPQGCGWVLGWIEVTVGTRWTTAKAASQPATIAQPSHNHRTIKYKQIVNPQPNTNKYKHNHTNKLSTHNQIQTNCHPTTKYNQIQTQPHKQIVNSKPNTNKLLTHNQMQTQPNKQIVNPQSNTNTTTQTNCQPTTDYKQSPLFFLKHSWPPSLLNGQSDETNCKENTVWICDWRPLKAFSNLV